MRLEEWYRMTSATKSAVKHLWALYLIAHKINVLCNKLTYLSVENWVVLGALISQQIHFGLITKIL